MPKVKGQCKQCGTEIEFWPSQARDYCSRKCMGLAHKGREMPNKPVRDAVKFRDMVAKYEAKYGPLE